MPQFDPTMFVPQLFWLAVMFIALYVVMSRHAIPRIGEVLEERQRRIDDNLSRAQQFKAEADLAIAQYERRLAESKAEALAVMKATADKLSAEAEARNKAQGERLAQQIKAGEGRIQEAKDKAMASVRGMAVEVAGAAVAKLAGIKADEAKLTAAVGAALQE